MECRKEKIFKNTYSSCEYITKKILSMNVTDERIHDSKALPGLVKKHYKIR
jgi:hypothetical protein